MKEETTLLHLLPGFERITLWAKHYLGRGEGDALRFMSVPPFTETHFTLVHVFSVLLVFTVVLFAALLFRTSLAKQKEQAIVPPSSVSARNLFEILTDAILGFMSGIMGAKNAEKYLPLIGTIGVFILGSNLLALIPGMEPPTASLKTNLALALSVFAMTHYYGIKEQGIKNYLKHFAGPIWVLAPFFATIELIGHIARPISLSLRLMGNMFSDHKIGSIFFGLVPLLVPVPFLVLGLIVAIVQTFVFCLLATVYIQLAVAHEAHDENHAEAQHQPDEPHP